MIGVRRLEAVSDAHVDQLVDMYAGEWWTETRTVGDVRVMLANSSIIVAFEEADDGRLAAFARVLTDRVYMGTLLDVIVRSDLRGRGLGDRLMASVLEHPGLARLRSLELMCREDKVAFYERWGFEVRAWRPPIRDLGRGAVMSRPNPAGSSPSGADEDRGAGPVGP